ncbi:MAG: proton-conducting transporter membrane subunit [Anaerolineae bacterium]
MNPLFLIIILPMAMAALIYVLRSWGAIAPLLTAATALILIGLCTQIPSGETAQVLGRALVFSPLNRLLLSFLLALVALMALYAWPVSQGWAFLPFTLLFVGLVSAALMIRPFLLAVLLLEIAALLLVFPMGGARAAQRYMVLVAAATPPLLLASWLMDLYTLNPDNQGLIPATVALLALGFGLLLAVMPLHLWLPAVAEEAPSMVTALVTSAFHLAVLLLLVNLLNDVPWLAAEPRARQVLMAGGLLTALGGGLLALPQERLSRLLAYSAISDLGFILVGLGAGSALGLTGAALGLVSRALALLLMAMGLGAMYRQALGPAATLAFIFGGLALSGFPLSGGFPGRWLICRAAFQRQPLQAYALLLASLLLFLGYLRALRAALSLRSEVAWGRGSWLVRGMIILLIVFSVLMGLYPQLILRPILPGIGNLTFVQ